MSPENPNEFDICDTLIVKESRALEEEIQKHKWIESEKAGEDVGYGFARVDWVLRRSGTRGGGPPSPK